MGTIDDLRHLQEGPYGVHAASHAFSQQRTTQFYGAQRQWQGMAETCDSLIRAHKIDPHTQDLSLYEIPAIWAIRRAYADFLRHMPSDIEECTIGLEDMNLTIDTVCALNEVTPFSPEDVPQSSVLHRLREGDIKAEHLTSAPGMIVDLSDRTMAGWNARRGKNKREMRAWDDCSYQAAVLGRRDVTAKRLHPKGSNKMMGHFLLQADYGERGLRLIDWGAEENVGVSDILASLMILELKRTTEKRILNVLESGH